MKTHVTEISLEQLLSKDPVGYFSFTRVLNFECLLEASTQVPE